MSEAEREETLKPMPDALRKKRKRSAPPMTNAEEVQLFDEVVKWLGLTVPNDFRDSKTANEFWHELSLRLMDACIPAFKTETRGRPKRATFAWEIVHAYFDAGGSSTDISITKDIGGRMREVLPHLKNKSDDTIREEVKAAYTALSWPLQR